MSEPVPLTSNLHFISFLFNSVMFIETVTISVFKAFNPCDFGGQQDVEYNFKSTKNCK